MFIALILGFLLSITDLSLLRLCGHAFFFVAFICAVSAATVVWRMAHSQARGLCVDQSGIVSLVDSLAWRRLTPLPWSSIADIRLIKSTVRVILKPGCPALAHLKEKDRTILTTQGCTIPAKLLGTAPDELCQALSSVWRDAGGAAAPTPPPAWFADAPSVDPVVRRHGPFTPGLRAAPRPLRIGVRIMCLAMFLMAFASVVWVLVR
ncbi:MAG: hypothetical protein LBM66_02590 [Bifidobacteriaceae bacterium]|jgi:hypothetical protein|nr:hypothetical protein [Bifidobacteriaceae bacterium]